MVVDTPRPSAGERSASRGPRDLWTADAVVDKARPDAEEVAMILVVGATGQLGSLVVRTLREHGQPVRAMVRDPAAAEDLAATGAGLRPRGSDRAGDARRGPRRRHGRGGDGQRRGAHPLRGPERRPGRR